MTPQASWATHKLGDLAKYVNGKAFKPTDWKTSGVPIIRIQNLTNASKPFNYFDQQVESRYLVDDGDLLISWSATLGSFIWNRGSAVLNQHIFKALPNADVVDRNFLHYLMLSTLGAMADQAHGIAMKHVTKAKFEAIEVAVPPLSEQRHIVERITECIERVAEIEKLRSSTRAQQQYLSASLIESEIQAITAHQENQSARTVGELITSARNGRSIAQDTSGQSNGAVLTLTAVRDIDLGLEYQKPIVLPDPIARQFDISEGDVFVSRANTMALVGLAAIASRPPSGRIIYPDLLIKLKADPSLVLPRYLAYALRSAGARKQIQARAFGSSQTMVKISGARLREIMIPVPPLAKQAEIVSRLDAAHHVIDELAVESAPGDVEALRGSILRKAFAGEL